jgi:hypothetical protein
MRTQNPFVRLSRWLLAGGLGLAVHAVTAADPAPILSLCFAADKAGTPPRAGMVLQDGSGNGQGAVVRGAPQWVTGRFGAGLRFASGDYLEVPGGAGFEKLTALSVEGWFCPDEVELEGPILISRWDHPEHRSFILYSKPPGVVEWGVGWTTDQYYILRDTCPFKAGEWQYIVGTWSGADGALRLYRNGELVQEYQTPAGVTLLDSAAAVLIGTQNNGPGAGQNYAGAVSRIRAWSRALTAAEIQATYQQQKSEYGSPVPRAPALPRLALLQAGSEKQLFLDDAFIDKMEGVKLTVNRPQATGENCVPVDKPWEARHINCFGESVIEIDGVCRLYYTAWDNQGRGLLCVATSQDGITWEKPALDVVPFGDIAKTNIVYPDASCPKLEGYFFGTCVFRDTNPRCPPEQRYKLINGDSSTWVFASPDGLHFKPMFDKPSFRPADTNNVCFFDERIGRYVAYMRSFRGLRVVGRCEFDDLANFGQDRIVFASDAEDREQLDRTRFDHVAPYNSSALKYPYAANAYVMFPSMFYHFPEPPVGKVPNDGIAIIHFGASRDGIHWTRPDRTPYLALREGENGHYMASGMIRRGDQLYLYYGVNHNTHGMPLNPLDHISRAVLRLDGFVSADAGAEGTLTTIPITFSGTRLELNVAGAAVRVGLLDEQGQAMAGFGTGDCDPIQGDHIARRVTWHGQDQLTRLAGRTVRLQFEMSQAKLYAFQFVP